MRFPRRLLVLNIGLLLLLGAVTLAPSSHAQRGGRARGDYTMVAGKITGSSSHAVYIVDSSNQEMVAVRWNESTKSLDAIGFRDLKEDAQLSPGR